MINFLGKQFTWYGLLILIILCISGLIFAFKYHQIEEKIEEEEKK
jgi:hypothetical protein